MADISAGTGTIVLNVARSILDDQAAMIAALQESDPGANNIEQIFGMASDLRQRLLSETEAGAAISELIKRVQLSEKGIRVMLKFPITQDVSDGALCSPISLSHFVPIRMRRRGVEMRLILNDQFDEPTKPTLRCSRQSRGRGTGSKKWLPAALIPGRGRAARRTPQALRHALGKAGVRCAGSH